jgi:hypothetical protein
MFKTINLQSLMNFGDWQDHHFEIQSLEDLKIEGKV